MILSIAWEVYHPSVALKQREMKCGKKQKQHDFTHVTLVPEILFACALYHLFQHLVVDVTQLERCSFRIESNAIKDMRKSRIAYVNIFKMC